jgi:HEPN domain-containing protein
MPPDPKWVKAWLDKAEDDLQAAEHLQTISPVFIDIVCFHAQQAVEKYLKAYLVSHDVAFEKVHTIRYLIDLCAEYDPAFDSLRDTAEPLTRYAVQGRYPIIEPKTTDTQSIHSLKTARTIREFILFRIPNHAKPDK